MKKEQKLISHSNLGNFQALVNDAFREGWQTVPSTLQISTSAASRSGDYSSAHMRTELNNAFVVVVERDVYPTN